jgi:hypothetical protein
MKRMLSLSAAFYLGVLAMPEAVLTRLFCRRPLHDGPGAGSGQPDLSAAGRLLGHPQPAEYSQKAMPLRYNEIQTPHRGIS